MKFTVESDKDYYPDVGDAFRWRRIDGCSFYTREWSEPVVRVMLIGNLYTEGVDRLCVMDDCGRVYSIHGPPDTMEFKRVSLTIEIGKGGEDEL